MSTAKAVLTVRSASEQLRTVRGRIKLAKWLRAQADALESAYPADYTERTYTARLF